MDCSSPPMAPAPRKERSNARVVDQTSWTRTWPELLEPRPVTNYNTKICEGQAQARRKSSDISLLNPTLPMGRWDSTQSAVRPTCVPCKTAGRWATTLRRDDGTVRNENSVFIHPIPPYPALYLFSISFAKVTVLLSQKDKTPARYPCFMGQYLLSHYCPVPSQRKGASGCQPPERHA